MLTMIQILNGNFLFGFLPESATVLLFGIVMVASTIGIRRFFIFKTEKTTNDENPDKENFEE